MKSATVSLKLYSLVLIFTSLAFLIFLSSKTFAQTLEHHAVCEAIYINGTGVPNGGTYPTPIKIGEKFHAEIKMKNLGEKPWIKDQNYKIGLTVPYGYGDDSLIWQLNRVELPNEKTTVNSGDNVTFKFDPSVGSNQTFGQHSFGWQMLKERRTDANGNIIDIGGRFGQLCNINLNIVSQSHVNPPADGTTPTTPTGISDPQPLYEIPMTAQTTCVDNSKNLQQVATKWVPVAGAKSYTTTFYESSTGTTGISATGFSGCLDARKNSFTFSKQYSASEKYRVNIIAYGGNNCEGGVVNRATIQEIPNGYISALSDGWKYNSIKFNPVGQGDIDFPLNTCSPFKLTLPQPTANVGDIPVTVTVLRSKLGTNILGTGESATVIFKYQPIEGGGSK